MLSAAENRPHISVLLDEAINYLSPKDGGVYVDGTFGAGGHTRAILQAADCSVYAIDRDDSVKKFVAELKEEFGDRITFIQGCFGDMEELLRENGVDKVDGILLDIGVSSMQIDTPMRGFSFSHDGPLDMRMGSEGESAADFVNNYEEEEIANVIYKYGDERKSRAIARLIVKAREEDGPIMTTERLAGIVKRAVRSYNDKINPATRTFQALRMWVNDELGELEKGLEASKNMLKIGGRVVIVTFHSGEDSIVKQFFNDLCGKGAGVSRYQPLPTQDLSAPIFKLVTRKAIKPSDDEVNDNIRARSAKIRAAEKISEVLK